MKKIPEKTLVVLKSLIPLVVIVFLFVVVGKLGASEIASIRSKISDARHDQSVLTQKLDLLRTVAVNGVEDSNVVTNTLPDGNPTLVVISQLKSLADSAGVALNTIKSSSLSTDLGNFKSVQIDFRLIGGKPEIENFLAGIGGFAPLSTLDTVKILASDNSFSANVTIKSYWAPLPTKLPATIEEFKDLTPEDKEVLVNIAGLTQPTFTSLPPIGEGGKSDPFSK